MEIGASVKTALVAVAWVGNGAKSTGPTSLDFGAVWQAQPPNPAFFEVDSTGSEETMLQEEVPDNGMDRDGLQTQEHCACGETAEAPVADPSPLHRVVHYNEAAQIDLNDAGAARDGPAPNKEGAAPLIFTTRLVGQSEDTAVPFQMLPAPENALPTSRGVHRLPVKALQTRSGERSPADIVASLAQTQGLQIAVPIAPSQTGASFFEQSSGQSRLLDDAALPRVSPSDDVSVVKTDDIFVPAMSGSGRKELGEPQRDLMVEMERAIRAPALKAMQPSDSEIVSSLSRFQADARQAQHAEETIAPLAPFEVAAETALGKAPSSRATMANVNISVAQHIQNQAQALIQKDGQSIEIQLNPTELGRVRMSLHHGDAALGLILTVERPETLDLLRRNSEILFAEFEGAGFENLSFEFRQEHKRPALDSARTDLPEVNVSDPDGEISTSATPYRTNRPAGRLDITI